MFELYFIAVADIYGFTGYTMKLYKRHWNSNKTWRTFCYWAKSDWRNNAEIMQEMFNTLNYQVYISINKQDAAWSVKSLIPWKYAKHPCSTSILLKKSAFVFSKISILEVCSSPGRVCANSSVEYFVICATIITNIVLNCNGI